PERLDAARAADWQQRLHAARDERRAYRHVCQQQGAARAAAGDRLLAQALAAHVLAGGGTERCVTGFGIADAWQCVALGLRMTAKPLCPARPPGTGVAFGAFQELLGTDLRYGIGQVQRAMLA